MGDGFNWSFLLGKFSTTTFFVESIDHEHVNGRMATSIHLKSGYFNSYRKILIDKAKMLDLIALDELFTLPDYKIDELLYHRVEKGWVDFLKVWPRKQNILSKESTDGSCELY